MRSVNDAAKTNKVWMGLLPSNKIVILYKDAWARHDGVKRQVVTPPVSTWKGNVIEIINTNGSKEMEKLITDSRFGGKTGTYFYVPQTGFVEENTIRMPALKNKELMSTIISL